MQHHACYTTTELFPAYDDDEERMKIIIYYKNIIIEKKRTQQLLLLLTNTTTAADTREEPRMAISKLSLLPGTCAGRCPPVVSFGRVFVHSVLVNASTQPCP